MMVQNMPEPMRSVQMGWLRMFAAPSAQANAFGGMNPEADRLLPEMRFNTEEEFHTKIEGEGQPLLDELRRGGRTLFDDRDGFQTFMFFVALQFTRTQRFRDRLKVAFSGMQFPPGFGDVDPSSIAGALRMISATSLATNYVMHREHCVLSMIESTSGAESITRDQRS
jgi:hypothetical protein